MPTSASAERPNPAKKQLRRHPNERSAYAVAKRIKGRKRHLLVDTLGAGARRGGFQLEKTLPILGHLLNVSGVPVHLTILGSGSQGNCAYLETSQTRLLIDAGLSGRQIRNRLAGIGRVPETLTGILITHEHSDHISGLVGIAAKLNLPIYCNRLTKEAIEAQLQIQINAQIFATGASFEIGDVSVDTFPIPHDAYDPVGYLVHTEAGNIGFLTDLGHATKLAIERVRAANVLLLEANHDVKMLQDDTRRPWSLKQRILSRHGHLSNESAADVVEQVISPQLRRLYLGHLSRDCNRPELARQVVFARLQRLGGAHVCLEAASQDVPCPTVAI